MDSPAPLDTRGRNILKLIEQSLEDAEDDAERYACQVVLGRVRAANGGGSAAEERERRSSRPPSAG
jgi:hypothetical protein